MDKKGHLTPYLYDKMNEHVNKACEKQIHNMRWEQHYENMPIQIYWKFYHQKMKIFR